MSVDLVLSPLPSPQAHSAAATFAFLTRGFGDGLDKPSPVLKLHSTASQLQATGWEGFSVYLCSVLKSVTWGEGGTKLLWKSFTRRQRKYS